MCAVIGTAVAPTDAALGAAIIEDRRMPVRIRRVLNVESGLNDGIVTPFVNFCLIAAVSGTSLQNSSHRHEFGATAAPGRCRRPDRCVHRGLTVQFVRAAQ
jgi:NhaP-type Na+/H+ or K+/H+ antiporter